ncbi:MAG TPA: RIP metalloprotease RseP [Ignavibacteriaceae bacterium]|nr:RIP metalloprotease RseP [Ignavibacteriaceae bacterium]
MEYVIYFALTIGILVFIHEFGHFIAAKACGMRAEVFAIGFGKRLFGWNKINGFTFGDLPEDFDGGGHTDYRLSLLPLGGYVKIAGMVDESFDTEFADKEPQPYEFRARPVYQKVIVITAGVIMNLLLALFVFWGSNFFQGKQIVKTTTIGYVLPGSKADSAGFKTDDKIISVNGESVTDWDELRNAIFINTAGEDLDVKLLRNGSTESLHVNRSLIPENENVNTYLLPNGIRPVVGDVLNDSPAMKAGIKAGDIFLKLDNVPLFSAEETIQLVGKNKNKTLPLQVLRDKDTLQLSVTPGNDGLIGISISQAFTGPVDYKKYGFFESFYYGWKDVIRITDLTFTMMGKVIHGQIAFGKAFGGPVRIAQIAAQSADNGFTSFMYFLALLSLSLAIINILPFPVLDGGHLIIIIIEAIIKREIPIKVKIAIQNTGFVLLLALMAFIIYNDILNL